MFRKSFTVKLAVVALVCLAAVGCTKRRRSSSVEMVAPKIHYILHCSAEDYGGFFGNSGNTANFELLKDRDVFSSYSVWVSILSAGQPAGPTSGGLFSANPGPLADSASVIVVGTNLDVTTLFNWVAADTTRTGETGPLSLSDMQGRWISENCVELVPPPSPLQAGGLSGLDGYVDLVVSNQSNGTRDATLEPFEGVKSAGHSGAWLYVDDGTPLSVSAVALGSKLPTSMLLAPGANGVWVNVTLANSTTDPMVVEAAALSFSDGSNSLNTWVNAYADYRHPSSDGDRFGDHPAVSDENTSEGTASRIFVPAGGTVTLPFLVNVSHHFPTATSATSVNASVSVIARAEQSKGTFSASGSATSLFRVAPTPVIKANGGDVWSAAGNTTSFSAGNGGNIDIAGYEGTLTFGSASVSVSAPSFGGSQPSDDTYDGSTTFPNTLLISGADSLAANLTEGGDGEIGSDTVTVTGSITSLVDANGDAFSLQIGTFASPADVVVFNGADIVLRGADDGLSQSGGENQNQDVYTGNGGSIVIFTSRFVCVGSNIDLRAGDVTGGPFNVAIVGQTGSFSVFIVDDSTTEVEIASSFFDLTGGDSAGEHAGNGGSFLIEADGGSDVDVVITNSTIDTSGGSSLGYSVAGLPDWVETVNSNNFSAGHAGNAVIQEDGGDLGDITVSGVNSFCLNGGYGATLGNGNLQGGHGGQFIITGGEDILIADGSVGTPGLSATGGSTGRFGGFGDTFQSSAFGGEGGDILLGDETGADSFTMPNGSVFSVIGGDSDDDAGDGGFILVHVDEGSITASGQFFSNGGSAREDSGNPSCGDAGNVSFFCDDDAISFTSTAVVWANGGSASLYGQPASGDRFTNPDGSTFFEIPSGSAGNVSFDCDSADGGEGTDTDDGDVTIDGLIFARAGYGVGASNGNGGFVNVTTGDNATTDQGDFSFTGTICLSADQTDFYTDNDNFGEENAGQLYVAVNGGSLSMSGLVEAIGDEDGDVFINDDFLPINTLEADGDAVLSGTFDVDGAFNIRWFGERINFSGTIGSASRPANDIEFENTTDGTALNNESLSFSGTIWSNNFWTIASQYDVDISGSFRSTGFAQLSLTTTGNGGGAGNGDPDITLTGTINFNQFFGSSISMQSTTGGSTTESNITLGGTMVADNGTFRVGSSSLGASESDEGSILFNGSTMSFTSSVVASVRDGEIVVASGRTLTGLGSVSLQIGNHPATVNEELVSIAGTLVSRDVFLGASVAGDDDGDVSVSGTIDASGATTSNVDGGQVDIELDDVFTLTGTINVNGANTRVSGIDRFGWGGRVEIVDLEDASLTGDDWTLNGTITANGGGDATTVTPGYFLEGGAGGFVLISKESDDEDEFLTINTTISANGGPSAHGPGGPGGVVAIGNLDSSSSNTDGGTLTLGGTTTVNGGSSTFTAAGYGGNGGSFFAAGGEVIVSGSHSADGGNGPAAGGNGGNMSVVAADDYANSANPVRGSGSLSAAGGNGTDAAGGFAGNGGSILLDNDSGTSTLPASTISTDVSAGTGTVAGAAGTVHREAD